MQQISNKNVLFSLLLSLGAAAASGGLLILTTDKTQFQSFSGLILTYIYVVFFMTVAFVFPFSLAANVWIYRSNLAHKKLFLIVIFTSAVLLPIVLFPLLELIVK